MLANAIVEPHRLYLSAGKTPARRWFSDNRSQQAGYRCAVSFSSTSDINSMRSAINQALSEFVKSENKYLAKIGADIKLLLAIAVFASVQEYLRARAGGLGMPQVGVVTFAERPVRASFIFIALVASAVDIAIIPQIVILWLLLQVISFLMVTRFLFLNLR